VRLNLGVRELWRRLDVFQKHPPLATSSPGRNLPNRGGVIKETIEAFGENVGAGEGRAKTSQRKIEFFRIERPTRPSQSVAIVIANLRALAKGQRWKIE